MMNIGIYLALEPGGGGVYQYEHTLVDILKNHSKENNYFIFSLLKDPHVDKLKGDRWEVRYLDDYFMGFSYKLLAKWYYGILKAKDSLFKNAKEHAQKQAPIDFSPANHIRNLLNNNLIYKHFRGRVDLMIYPSMKPFSKSDDIPFVVAIHDLQHLLNPVYPEVSKGGERKRRELYYRYATQKALAILVDSEVGKEDVINNYGVQEEKIKVLPFLPPKYLFEGIGSEKKKMTKEKYGLKEGYLFYPAQFWPHKNHIRLIKALSLVKKKWDIEIPLVLAGNKNITHSTFKEVLTLAKELSVLGQVTYLGYVPSEDMGALYSMASALVMPTFFGPTNIPVAEAFVLGCPVITSDIRGIREQVGEAGLLVDPESVDDMAGAMHRIYTDRGLRESLKDRGFKRAAQWTEDEFAKRLISIIEYCRDKLKKDSH
jgi:glycosyltransferase involved in cell wall biosynthesis